MWEHRTGTEFSPELSASVVHRGVELYVPTSLPRTRDERQHWRQTATVVTVVLKCLRELSCNSPPLWPQVFELVSTRCCVTANDAHCIFDGVQQNALTIAVMWALIVTCVNVDPKVSNCSCRKHRCVTNTSRTSRDLKLTSSGWTTRAPRSWHD